MKAQDEEARSAEAASSGSPAKPQKHVPFGEKVAFGSGMFVDHFGAITVKNLANPIYNLALGLNPALIGLVLALNRLWDAFTDPIMGNLSDNSRLKWGRRKPFMLMGGILAGLVFPFVWFCPEGMSVPFTFGYFLVASVIYYTCHTIFGVPHTAVGYEMTPDYDERTRVMTVRAIMGHIAAGITPWIYALTQLDYFDNTMQGMRVVGIGVGFIIIGAAIIPAYFIQERYRKTAQKQTRIGLIDSLKSTFKNRPFVQLVIITVLMNFGVNSVYALGFYVNVYYVHSGDTAAASIIHGWAGTVGTGASVLAALALTVVSERFSKKKVLVGCLWLTLITSFSQWFLYTPHLPYLQILVPVLLSPGLAGYWLMINSLKADVVDVDELETGRRREGLYGAASSWIYKLALSLNMIISGLLLTATGFDQSLGGDQSAETITLMRAFFSMLPAVAIVAALYVLSKFELTRERMREIRTQLEQRRGSI